MAGRLKVWNASTSSWDYVATGMAADYVSGPSGSGRIMIPGLAASPDIAPASPSAYDDEFASLSGWTTLGSLDVLNATDAASHAHLKKSTSAAFQLDGIYKACPSTPFTVTAKVSDMTTGIDYSHVGILIAAASPGALFVVGAAQSASGAQNAVWGAYSSRTARSTWAAMAMRLPCCLRLVVTSSTSVDGYASASGMAWMPMFSGVNPGFTVGSVGLYVSGDAAVPAEQFCDWIRFS